MLKKVLAWVVLGFVIVVPMGQAASDVISPPNPLPFFELSTPQDPARLAYLGVDAKKTKFFVGVKRGADGQAIVFFTHLGVFESVEGFLAEIIAASGMKGGK